MSLLIGFLSRGDTSQGKKITGNFQIDNYMKHFSHSYFTLLEFIKVTQIAFLQLKARTHFFYLSKKCEGDNLIVIKVFKLLTR